MSQGNNGNNNSSNQGAGTQGAGAQGASGQGDQNRTFTQAELDQVVQERLGRERAKYADYETLKEKAAKYDQAEEASKTELQKAQEKANDYKAQLDAMKKAQGIQAIREKVAAETKVPANLLSGETEEDCKAQAKAIIDFAKPNGYPGVKDAGEAGSGGGGDGNAAQQFAEWMKQMQG